MCTIGSYDFACIKGIEKLCPPRLRRQLGRAITGPHVVELRQVPAALGRTKPCQEPTGGNLEGTMTAHGPTLKKVSFLHCKWLFRSCPCALQWQFTDNSMSMATSNVFPFSA